MNRSFFHTALVCGLTLSVVACKKSKTAPVEEETAPPSIVHESTALVYQHSSGKLAYNLYANEGETDKRNTIPDFSYAGYKGGGVALPDVPVKKTLNPVAGDNRAQIQAAIAEVEALAADANGFRGAILLKAGTYEVEGTLTIRKGGVVLRGEGQGSNGTILKATQASQHTLIDIAGTGSGTDEINGTRKKITGTLVPTGTLTVDVEDASGFKVGDEVGLYRVPNNSWISLLDMAQYGWTADAYDIVFERKITGINGRTITLNAPVVDPIKSTYAAGYLFKSQITGRISNCGVENMRLESSYASNDDEEHGWIGVSLKRASNCWVKQVTALYFGYSAVYIGGQSVYNTVEECAMLDPKSVTTGGRKYSFNVEGGAAFNLFQRCYTRGGRHDFVTGSRVPGPNVFLDGYSTQTNSDIGPHHRWATGILFDNIYGGQIYVQNRKEMGSGHGWAGAQIMFWNCVSTKTGIKVESPAGAKNWGIGCSGPAKMGAGYFESWGVAVQPRSLYLTQLKDRLGSAAVNNIATTAQLDGSIRTKLQTWAGEGKL